MLAQLAALWHSNPDMRLGQLVTNLAQTTDPYTFYMEDEEMEERIKNVLHSGSWGEQASPVSNRVTGEMPDLGTKTFKIGKLD
jgi:hypothetical protein